MAHPDDLGEIGPNGDLTGTRVGRFRIHSRLGSGGMGEVYLAEDTTLKRTVALKRLAPRLRADQLYRHRLLKEAQRASCFSDQHIAHIHDVIEHGDEIFLVMEYVEGTTLRQLAQNPISVGEFLKIAIQCAEALVVAHGKRIVHCDIKPENIMLTAVGQVKMLDFGIAKRTPTNEANTTTDNVETGTGTLLGTRAYIAPEVLHGKAPDARADIFSLGVVFYEVLTGHQPLGNRASPGVGGQSVLSDNRLPGKSVRQIPKELDRIIGKMLAPDAAARYATAVELVDDLRAAERNLSGTHPVRAATAWLGSHRVLTGSLSIFLLLTLLIAILTVRHRVENWGTSGEIPQDRQLAVLPFTGGGADAESRAFADGLAETLTAKLSQLMGTHRLQVVPWSEVRAQGVNTTEQAWKQFAVNLVVAGSLQRSNGVVRVTLVVIDPKARRQVSADSIDAPASDPFSVEDRVVSSVVAMLRIEPGEHERGSLAAHGTLRPAAYDYYLRGRGYLQDYQKPENLESAITVFKRALEVDADYALAYAGLGDAYWYKFGLTRDGEWVNEALAACERSVALDPRSADGHACLGTVYAGEGKYETAVEHLQFALRLDPNNDDFYRSLGLAYEHLNKSREAEEVYREAIRLRPQYWAGYNRLGTFYYAQARYKDAAEMFTQVIALAPDNVLGYSNLGGVYIAESRYADAIPLFERSVTIQPTTAGYSNLATSYFQLRRFADAARVYEQAVKVNERDYTSWGNLADAVYRTPGKQAAATEAYRRAISLAEKRLRINPRDAPVMGDLADYYSMLGARPQALRYLKQALAIAPSDPLLKFQAAEVYDQLGDTDQAVKWLEEALAAGYSRTIARDTPVLDNIRSDRRVQRLLQGN